MKNTLHVLLLCFWAVSAWAQHPTYEEMADSIDYWVTARVEVAAAGHPETVEMPFVVRSLAWGCLCPDHYLGVGTGVKEGPFIHPVRPENFPTSNETGHSLIVRGHFTGRYVEEDYRDADGYPEEWLYIIPEFVITDWEYNTLDYNVAAPRILPAGE